ncbi:amino acid ABC transporter substrate-binding protein (PAAT family) [Lachnotalea glycerini]|uniref:Amino acid ABC transporter substrate-binding protein (PAAT family) n=1 Tax=Lachnotalea glycerini TaxID=1763509 RepID=A0A318EY20_9FIRM|nr:transporter substrate-binding domain-containing protein [Lachnotalea glycerini]PXV95976.1 amino acid ABC transporter substrate-binding protein (PAAT family) [Lachnotalea glycerini]
MKIKKLIAVIMMLTMIITLAACSKKEEDTSADDGSKATDENVAEENTDATASDASSLTIKDGVLQVGTEASYPPMEYLDEDGTTYIGFDIEVAQAIADELGLKLEIDDVAWDGIFASLDSDRYDCIIAGVSINEEREAAYNLTKPYVANRIALVTKKDSDITSPEDLKGKSVAYQTETTSDYYMKDLIKNGLEPSETYPYDKIIQAFDDLKVGRVDSVMTDIVVASYYMGNDSDKLEVVWKSEESEPMAICLKKGNDALTEKIEKAVDTLYENGKMAEIATKYFGYDITEDVR